MNMVRSVVRPTPISEKIIRAVIYIVMAAVFATFLKIPISDWLMTQDTILQNELTINIVSIGLGFIAASLVIYALKRRTMEG